MNKINPILAIETSESICGACVYFDENKYFEINLRNKNVHAEKLFEITEQVIKEAGIEPDDLSAIAVSSGPGSFTGLRIGMSAAKGMAFGLSLPIIPVPTFEAMALQVSSFLKAGTEFIIANKVNVEEVYYAKFQSAANLLDRAINYIFAENLKIINLKEFAEFRKDCLVFGNAEASLKNSGGNNYEGRFNITAPQPVFIARWAALYGEKLATTNYDFLEPNYLKDFIIKERKNV